MNVNSLIFQLKALGEPTRLELATLLSQREWGGLELLERLEVSQPNLSRHLKMLREAGVIQERRVGRNAYYRLSDNTLNSLVVALATGRTSPESEYIINNVSKRPQGNREEDITPPEEDRPKSGSIEEWLL